MSVTIDRKSLERDVRSFSKRTKEIVKDFDKGPRKRVLRKGVTPIRKAARSLTPVGTKVHFYRRGNKETKINPGNLRRSIDRILGLRKSRDEFIGPRLGAAGKESEIGKPGQKADGYYAAMVFGSQKRFQSRVLFAAVRLARSTAIQRMKLAARKEIQRIAAQKRLR
ncbi:MAG: hypothetical protein AAF741_14145 [Bacteroidota bacterium]